MRKRQLVPTARTSPRKRSRPLTSDGSEGSRSESDSNSLTLSHTAHAAIGEASFEKHCGVDEQGWEKIFDDAVNFKILRDNLNEKFHNTRIDVQEAHGFPYEIRFVATPSEEVQEVYGTGFVELLPHSELDKYYNVENEEINRRLKVFLFVLKNGLDLLTCDFGDGDIKNTTWNIKQKQDTGNQAGDTREATASGQYIHELKLASDLVCSLVQGMTDGMQNSRGRQFMVKLLEAGLYVCLPEEGRKKVKCWSVGSSATIMEGFRVRSGPPNILSDIKKRLDSMRPVDKMNLIAQPGTNDTVDASAGSQSDISGVSVCSSYQTSRTPSTTPATSSKTSDVEKSVNRESHNADYVFPDVVVTLRKNDFAGYLVVVEVKSTKLSGKEISQMYRKIIGAGMRQNVVFGVLVNHVEAKIWKMTVDKQNRCVNFSKEVYFYFPIEGMDGFFRHLLAIMDYAYENVSNNAT